MPPRHFVIHERQTTKIMVDHEPGLFLLDPIMANVAESITKAIDDQLDNWISSLGIDKELRQNLMHFVAKITPEKCTLKYSFENDTYCFTARKNNEKWLSESTIYLNNVPEISQTETEIQGGRTSYLQHLFEQRPIASKFDDIFYADQRKVSDLMGWIDLNPLKTKFKITGPI